jgi:VWFA-related protein
VVDVVATDARGEPITNLEAQDFAILENGKQQQVSSFNLQLSPVPKIRDAQARVEELPPNVFTNTPHYTKTGAWNVLLMDFMNSQVTSQADLRQQLVKVLQQIPDEPVAVYILTNKLHLLQDFSMDRAALGRLIEGLKNHASANLDNAKGGHEMERYPAGFLDFLLPQSRLGIIRSEADMTAARTDVRLHQTVEALNQIVRNVAALPGRKNLIWVSQAFPFTLDPGVVVQGFDAATGRNFDVSMPGTANALLDSQVVIYPIDPSGMHLPDEFDPAGRADALGRRETVIGADSTINNLHKAETATHSSVNELAERTGGRAFYNRNDIGDAIVQSMHDGGTYYTLTYYPADKNWNGKFRKIGVKVNRSGIKLRYRSGYFAIDPGVKADTGKVSAAQEAQFRQAMELEAPVATSLLFNAKVMPASSPQGNGIVVNFQLQPGAVSTEIGADGLQHLSVECAVEAFNEKGEPVNAAANTMTGALKPEVYEKVSRAGFPCRETLDLHPGKYLLRFGLRDNMSGRIGTADGTVVLPEPAK